ncbi:MAG TPA: dipeptide epimerase [Sulfurimonas sp.]|nr:dipeptide epimerase [Sulfurimonas sp.]
MKITQIEIQRLDIGLKKPFITALRRVDEVNDIIIKIHTDSTYVGYGEACAVTAITGTKNEDILKDLEEEIFPLLINKKLIEKYIFTSLHALNISPETKACVDMAIYDILSKTQGLSLHKYLGAKTSSLQTDITISVNEPIIMQEETQKAINLGFDILKIKLDSDLEKNIQRLEYINSVLPSHIKLRLDPNQALSLTGCLDMLSKIQINNIECIEQPFSADDIISMKTLKDKNIIPVLADESLFSLADAQLLLEEDAIDLLNIKLMKCGGIFEALKMASLAQEFRKSCMIGSMLEGPISLLAAVHFGLSQDNVQMADLDSPLYLKEHPLLEPFYLIKDRINLCEKPGLGIDDIIQSLQIFPVQ